ncbi:Domain of unknown function DUF143 [Elusimicrobium minutum Pei191]|uniref:Ribosomal silencing factor RsfS n=1 Tax=Elusimicrobium minutum (strain Pei191) TaxID=445932 RepID=B2KD55_ELUMP|nr:ribosome silencing factor [Elusimicrobium minutum]ACC98451.1 Domain of unknown function DUF143 [Elusimicrobium minutum Pei191]
MNTKELVFLTARYADEKKAENVTVIDLKGMSSLCDYIVLATVTSRPHLEAVEQEVSTNLKQVNLFKTKRDGGESNMWRVSDYGAFMLHLMTKEARDFYALDKIFSFGEVIDWQEKPQIKEVKKTAAKKETAKKTTVKKAATKKTTQKKAAVKKTAVKKTTAKKAAVKKTVKKAAPKKAVKKAAPKKVVKKAAVKKTPKKTTKKK